ncbi:MAG: biotin attachment protein [Thermoleophilaceae bacterium]|nr:biotin attachment protein [Thermoleophilaceae bacterium]
MAEIVKMPKWGLSMEEGTITEWMVGPGEDVAQGEVLAMVESEKAQMELPSPVGGVFAKALVEEGQTVEVGTDVCVIAADRAEYEAEFASEAA